MNILIRRVVGREKALRRVETREGGSVGGRKPSVSRFDTTEGLWLCWRDVGDGRGHLAGEETGFRRNGASNPWQD